MQVNAPTIFIAGLACCAYTVVTGNPWGIPPAFACLLAGLYLLGD